MLAALFDSSDFGIFCLATIDPETCLSVFAMDDPGAALSDVDDSPADLSDSCGASAG